MAGNKTHDQQVRIIEEKVNTKNADDDFNAEEELKRSKQQRVAREESNAVKDGHLVDPDDREMLRGENQESRHHKRPAD